MRITISKSKNAESSTDVTAYTSSLYVIELGMLMVPEALAFFPTETVFASELLMLYDIPSNSTANKLKQQSSTLTIATIFFITNPLTFKPLFPIISELIRNIKFSYTQ